MGNESTLLEEIDILKTRTRSVVVLFLGLFTVLLLSLSGTRGQVQDCLEAVTDVRTLLPSEWNVPYPAGLTYSRNLDQLFLLDKSESGPSPTEQSTVVVITPHEDLIATADLAFDIDAAINVAFDDAGHRLLLLNNELAQLAQIDLGADGLLDPTTLKTVDVAHLGLKNAQGMDVDVDGRQLFILDGAASQLVSVDLDAEFGLIAKTDLHHLGTTQLRGLAVHPTTRNLYTVDPTDQVLYELTPAGQFVNRYDLSELNLIDPRGLDFAPSTDLTDAPDIVHLFIADSNLPDPQSDSITTFFRMLSGLGGREATGESGTAPVFGRVPEVALPSGASCGLTRTFTAQVASSSDDAEERHSANRTVVLDSTDLELIQDGTTIDQTVGVRFTDVDIPAGATIATASIEFDTDEMDSGPTSLVIHGEATDDAAPFAAVAGTISGRNLTAASVAWLDVPAWTMIHETNRTPDLAPIVQEIVNRPGWRSGNALAFIISGSGKRTAEAYDGEPAHAARLVVEYSVPPAPTPTPAAGTVRFAVIGDYGNGSDNEDRVANLVDGWNPDFVITTGDNNYPDGEAATIDDHIGQYYAQFIGNYTGSYGPGSTANRFWPSLGNHDWHTITCTGISCSGGYFDYFTLPNNERYYDVDLGLIHLFALDSDSGEPDGRNQNSIQASWLQNQLSESTSCYNLVYFHHAAYSSGKHGSNTSMQWPFATWGADAVLSGHDHTYERLQVDAIPYFVNGAGGAGLYDFDNIDTLPPGATSVVRYNQDHGAMLVTATASDITYQFYTTAGVLIDDYTVPKNCAGSAPTATPVATATPAAGSSNVVNVPGDAATIQAGIDLASDGDIVLVAPGKYYENVQIADKTITLASQFYTTQDLSFIDQTIIDGAGSTVITVAPSVGPATKITGFTIQNGDDGISASATLHILHNRFTGNKDAIDYEAGGGICRNNLFENNSDDAVDLDGPTAVTIEDNMLRNSNDDGIEIRLHPYSGPTLDIVVRRNVISGNNHDGIQLIDHPGESDRFFVIEHNLIEGNGMAGLGLMDNGESQEDFRGASIPDRIHLFNNTFRDNGHGVAGGDTLIAINNIFAGSRDIALKNVDGNSSAAYNLFWENGTDYQNSNVDTANSIWADPLLDADGRLSPDSPAIDAGTAYFMWNSEVVLNLHPNDYAGTSPDLGAYEAGMTPEPTFLSTILK